jgi:hypothetical protein
MTCLVDRFPCPVCGRRPELMAGINVPNGDEEKRYLVCWQCGLVADHVKNGQPNWVRKFRPETPKRPKKKKKRARVHPREDAQWTSPT